MPRLFSIAFVAISSVVNAQSAADRLVAGEMRIWEPPMVTPESLPGPTVPKPMITSIRLAKTRIALGKTTLEDVHRLLGGTIGHKGDAGGSLSWLCFHGTDPVGPWAVWLESSEVAGGSVNGFALQRVAANAVIDSRCQPLSDEAGLPLGLRLDLPENTVRKILGRPTFQRQNMLVYYHEHEEAITGEPFTAANSVCVIFRRDSLWFIETWKTTTS